MTDFVEQCLREWRRLHVPDSVADEMAAELAADLEEARVEGMTPEDVLGSGAADPRSFAAAWAAELGVVPLRKRGAPRAVLLAALAALGNRNRRCGSRGQCVAFGVAHAGSFCAPGTGARRAGHRSTGGRLGH